MMSGPMDIKGGGRRRTLDDVHGTFFLGDAVNDSDAADNEFNRNDKELERSSLERRLVEQESENVKEQYVKPPALRTIVSGDSDISATGSTSAQEISYSQDEFDVWLPDMILLTNDEEDTEEIDISLEDCQLPPAGDLKSFSDRLEDSGEDTLNNFAASHCANNKDAEGPRRVRDLSDVSFQRTSLPRSQTCPVITTSAFSRSQVVAVCRGTDNSKTTVTYPLGFSHKWTHVVARGVAHQRYGASQDASRPRSRTFHNEKDVQHLQQRQQVHQHLQQEQQQETSPAEKTPPRRGRSHSESDLHFLRLKGMGREIRKMSDEFDSWRSKRMLMTVREEDADSSVDSVHYSSSFPGSAGIYYWFDG